MTQTRVITHDSPMMGLLFFYGNMYEITEPLSHEDQAKSAITMHQKILTRPDRAFT